MTCEGLQLMVSGLKATLKQNGSSGEIFAGTVFLFLLQ